MTSLNAEKYLSSHHILIYLEDAICQLLEQKEENSKVNPAKFLADYFNGIKRGTHTLFREYRFISATPYNRACFTHTFWKCFRYIGKKQDLLQVREYHALLSLLCFDFPYEIVQKTARIILMDDALDCLMSFADFIYAFQVQFYLNEFLAKCAEAFNKLLTSPHSPRDAVVVPTETSDDGKNTPPHDGKEGASTVEEDGPTKMNGGNSDTVDAQLFLKSLVSHCEKTDYNAPLPSVLREILLPMQRVSFYGFIMALVKCESLNSSIGKLPPKNKLLDYEGEKEARDSSADRPVATDGSLGRPNNKTTPVTKYALQAAQFGNVANKYGMPSGKSQNGRSSPLPGVHHSRLHTPVAMTRSPMSGTAVSGSEEALESGVGASVDGSGVESSDSSREPSSDDDDADN